MNWDTIEPRIRDHVKVLHKHGFKTTSSCGHEMWITLDPSTNQKLLETFLDAIGYKDYAISRQTVDGKLYNIKVEFLGDLSGDNRPFDLVLLKVDPQSHPLYFVINARHYDHHDNSDHHVAYYYDEHTCPINWTRNIVAVIAQGDEDPHGFAKFVKRIPAPDNMDEHGRVKEDRDGSIWTKLFPEIEIQ